MSYALSQLICEPTFILPNSFSCIDLIFTNENNFIMDCGVYASLHPICHHQIVYAKLNFRNWIASLYERLVWHYKISNSQLLNYTIKIFKWEKLLENKNVYDQLYLFNKTILNAYHNFIPNKNITCYDKNPPWFNNQIKTLIEKKIHLFKGYMANGRLAVDHIRLQKAGAELVNIIKYSKENF